MRRSVILALVSLLGVGLAAQRYYPSIQGAQDVQVYRDIATSLKTGGALATDTGRYPPLACSVFLLLSTDRMGWSFAAQWTMFLIVLVGAAALYQGLAIRKDTFHWLPAAVFGTVFLLHQELVFARYDLLIGVLIYLTWKAHEAGRAADSGAFLMLAAALKIVPILLLPLLWLATPRSARGRLLAGIGVGIALAALIPVLVLGPSQALANTGALLARSRWEGRVTVETTWSGIDMLWQMLRGGRAQLTVRAQAWDNADLGNAVSTVASLLVVVGAAALTIKGWQGSKASHATIGPLLIAVLAWTLAVSPVVSPQYLVWIMPSLLTLRQWTSLDAFLNPLAIAIAASVYIVGLATQWIYPLHYGEFLNQVSPIYPLIVTVRNITLFVLVKLLLSAQAAEWQAGARAMETQAAIG